MMFYKPNDKLREDFLNVEFYEDTFDLIADFIREHPHKKSQEVIATIIGDEFLDESVSGLIANALFFAIEQIAEEEVAKNLGLTWAQLMERDFTITLNKESE